MVRDDDARHIADVRPPSAVEGYKELPLPEPPSLAKMVGPGIIAVGIGMAAGEFILWPVAVIRGGLGLLWLALVTLVIQVFINMEIERYTLATGETAMAGFTRLWKPIGLLICLAGLFQYVFPGWATSAASVTAILTGGSVKWIAIGALVIVGLALTVSPVIYTLLERVEFFKVACTFTRVRFVAEHYDSPEAAQESAERLRGLPGSRVVSYVVEERRPS